MNIQVKHKGGVGVIRKFSKELTMQDLCLEIETKSNIPITNQKLLLGHPPIVLEFTMDMIVTELLSNGDSIFIEETQKNNENPKGNSGNDKKTDLSGGEMVKHTVPADNSCLFRSISYLLDLGDPSLLRQICSAKIKEDPVYYSDGILGYPHEKYINWIVNPDHWGGSIELLILAKHFQVEIYTFDIRTVRVEPFGQDIDDCQNRIFVMYDGIHYDPLVMKSNSQETKVFSRDDDKAIAQGHALCEKLNKARQFVSTADFKVRCLTCQKPLNGEKQAKEHASLFGHVNFGEL